MEKGYDMGSVMGYILLFNFVLQEHFTEHQLELFIQINLGYTRSFR